MRKVFCVFCLILILASSSYADVNPELEVQKIIGGLYSLAVYVCLNGKINPDISNLTSFFKDIPEDWQENAKVVRVNSSIWVGVNVNQYSTARAFLRENAEALNITESPAGYAWIGGDEAWIKAGNIYDEKIHSLAIKAAKGSGNDSDIIFLSNNNQDSWWQMNPTPNTVAAREILSRWGVKNAPELHKPEGNKVSIYESVKPSEVIRKPAGIHIATRKNRLDMSMNIGNVVFTPVPQLRHDRTTVEEIEDDNTSSDKKQEDKTKK